MSQIKTSFSVVKISFFNLVAFLCLNSPMLYSQAPDTLWNKTYSHNAMGYEVINTLDGGFAVIGDITFGGANTDMQIIKTDVNGDTTWTSTYDIGTNEYANSIKQTDDEKYIITGGLKFGPSANPYNTFLLKLGSDPTGLSENVKYIPQEFILEQNYPNPFNPNTTIEFLLPKSNFVELKVYNLLGKEVSTLVSKKLNSGNHIYTFDAKNLASGVYYYKLVAGDYREAKKMILLK